MWPRIACHCLESHDFMEVMVVNISLGEQMRYWTLRRIQRDHLSKTIGAEVGTFGATA